MQARFDRKEVKLWLQPGDQSVASRRGKEKNRVNLALSAVAA